MRQESAAEAVLADMVAIFTYWNSVVSELRFRDFSD